MMLYFFNDVVNDLDSAQNYSQSGKNLLFEVVFFALLRTAQFITLCKRLHKFQESK